jgi:VWFA-related protein
MRLLLSGLLVVVLAPALVRGQVRIPNRPSEPLFKGKQGAQKTEVHYDPATRTVTIKFVVQDQNGYFIPDIRRENLAVFDDGVRQSNTEVTVEHAPVSMALLMEYGGRHPALNRDLADELSPAAHQLLDSLGHEDSAAIWTYADTVKELAGFTREPQQLDRLVLALKPPDVSETNLYDAVIFATGRMRQVKERKAVLLLSSGIDTFSKATYNDALNSARQSDAPIYAVSLAQPLKTASLLNNANAVRIDWDAAEKKLEELAKASGGRFYSPPDTINLSGIYGDIIENLKVRYVVSYRLANPGDAGKPHMVKVQLVEAGTEKPLRIVDAGGRPVHANVIAEGNYTPAAGDGGK